MKISYVGDYGEDITPIIERVLTSSESFRESIRRFMAAAKQMGWRCGELKEVVPGIWAIRES